MSYENFQELDEAILTLTGSPEWKAFVHVLGAENYNATQNQLDASDWGEFKFQQGYRQGLFFAFNLREYTKRLVENDNADV